MSGKKTGFKKGRLGIGTDDPQYPLDIVGDIRLTGGIRDASGRPLLATVGANGNIELFQGWEKDSSGNLYVMMDGSQTNEGSRIYHIGVNKSSDFKGAMDVSGGLTVDVLMPAGPPMHLEGTSQYINHNTAVNDDLDLVLPDDSKHGFDVSGDMHLDNMYIRGGLMIYDPEVNKFVNFAN